MENNLIDDLEIINFPDKLEDMIRLRLTFQRHDSDQVNQIRSEIERCFGVGEVRITYNCDVCLKKLTSPEDLQINVCRNCDKFFDTCSECQLINKDNDEISDKKCRFCPTDERRE